MSDIDIEELGPKMTAELWIEVAKQLQETTPIGTPFAFVSVVEESAYRAAVAAVVTWARIRGLRAVLEKETA